MALNLNTATAGELQDMGIRPDIAQKIVDHREKTGSFMEWDDLKQVPGIKPDAISTLKKAGVTIEEEVEVAG